MKRRTFLAVIGSFVSVGCTAPASTSRSPPGEDTPFDPRNTFKTVEIGSRTNVTDPVFNKPHTLHLWNVGSDMRTIDVTIIDTKSESVVLDRSFEFPRDSELEIKLNEPSAYQIEITPPERDRPKTIDIPRRRFDCNVSHHEISILRDGDVSVNSSGTLLNCPSERSNATGDDS